MDGVGEILTLALHGGVEVNKSNVLLVSYLFDVGNDSVIDDTVVNAPGMTVCGNRQTEPYLGLGRQGAE